LRFLLANRANAVWEIKLELNGMHELRRHAIAHLQTHTT
jgi:hypothetical protein